MSNVIRFLEAMGKNPILSPDQYAAAVAALDVNDDQRGALLARDHNMLSDMLGGRKRMLCLVVLPDQVVQIEDERLQ